MNPIKQITIFTLVLTLTVTGAWAGIPDTGVYFRTISSPEISANEFGLDTEQGNALPDNSLVYTDVAPAVVDRDLARLVMDDFAVINENEKPFQLLSAEELETVIQERLSGAEKSQFWTRRKVATILLLAVLLGLLAFFGDGAGAGDGSGSGSGSGNGTGQPGGPSNPPGFGPEGGLGGGGGLPLVPGGTLPEGGTGDGNGSGGGGQFPYNGPIPHHPEPSTMLLMGLGFLLPLLRRKKS